MDDDRLALTVEEAARLLGISRTVAYAAVQDGVLPAIRIGRRIVVPRHLLLEMLDRARPEDALHRAP